MESIKIVVDGRWANQGTLDNPVWKLMVFPIASKSSPEGGHRGIFVLMEGGYRDTPPNVIIDERNLTLHNFGSYDCGDGIHWHLLLTTPIAMLADTSIDLQVKHGYVFLEDTKPKDTGDDLDMWIFRSLGSLTGPRAIQFNGN